jgi:hypothetical protein
MQDAAQAPTGWAKEAPPPLATALRIDIALEVYEQSFT